MASNLCRSTFPARVILKQPVDLINNYRLRDFYFERLESAVIREIYLKDIASISPNLLIQALYAPKSNLVSFWDDEFIISMNISANFRTKNGGLATVLVVA